MPRNSNQSKASNYSINFNNDGYIDINPGASSGVDLTSFTIAAWVKWDTESNSYGTAIRLSTSGDDIWMYVGRSTGFNFGVRFYVGSTALDDPDFLPTNEWKHVIVRYDESATSMKIYVDGQEKVSSTVNKNPSLWNTTSINQIGANGSSGEKMRGELSQISVFDYALSTNQISALYNSGIPANPLAVTTPPIAYYDLGQGSAYASGSAGIIEPNLAQATGSTVFDFIEEDYIEAPHIDNSGEMSISGWFRTTSNAYNMIYNEDEAVRSGGDRNFFLSTVNQMMRFTQFWQAGGYTTVNSSGVNVNDGNWHHVVATWDGTTDTNGIKVFIDAALRGQGTAAETVRNNDDVTGQIGGTNATYDFTGDLSNIQVWDKGLTSSEVSTLYNNGTPLQSYTDVPQSGSLKAWYKLDQSANWEADSSGNWQIPDAVSAYPQSFNFDGSNDFIDLGTTTDYDTGDLSAAIWVNITNTGGTQYIFSNSGSPSFLGFDIKVRQSNQISVSRSSQLKSSTPGWINVGFEYDVWQHLAFTFNYATNTIKTFLNGELKDTSIGVTESTSLASKKLTIGSYKGTLSFTNGKLSNAQIWNTTLLDSQIETLYNNGTPLTTAIATDNLKGWYKLDNTATFLTNWSVPDASGNGNTGTSSGMTEQNLLNNNVSALNGESSGMDSTNLVASNLIKSIPYSGYSMNFDAGSGYKIDIGTSLANGLGNGYTGDITVSMWFNADTVTSDDGLFTIKTGSSFGNITFLITSNTARMYYNNDGTHISGSVSTNQWYNLVGILSSGDASNTKLYLNNNAVATATTTPNSSLDFNGMDTWIGNYWAGNNALDGKISNVAIWDRAITEDEILRVYNGGSPGDLSSLNPTSWWSLGADSYFNGSNWICPDIGANTNDGTSANMAADDLVGNGPDSLANGTSTNLDLSSDLIGNAPGSTGNAISVNMNFTARTGSTP